MRGDGEGAVMSEESLDFWSLLKGRENSMTAKAGAPPVRGEAPAFVDKYVRLLHKHLFALADIQPLLKWNGFAALQVVC